MVRKLRSIAFQRCILRGGLPLVEVSQNEDFVQKTASKTAFLRDTKSDQLTLSSHNSCSKPPNLKNYHIFGILRTSAFTQYIMTIGNWNGSTNPTAFFEVMTRTLGSRLQSRAFMHGCLKHQLFSNDLLCSTKIETLFSLSASNSPQIRFKT